MKRVLVILISILSVIAWSILTPALAANTTVETNAAIAVKWGNSGWGVVQPMWIKSWIVKKAMQAVAYALRYSLSWVKTFLNSIGATQAEINIVASQATSIANALDRVAIYFDYYSATTKTIIMQQLQAQWFSFTVSYWVAQIVDFVAF